MVAAERSPSNGRTSNETPSFWSNRQCIQDCAAGVTLARLDVALDNARAIRFYEKHGWVREQVAIVTLNGPFDLRVLVLTK